MRQRGGGGGSASNKPVNPPSPVNPVTPPTDEECAENFSPDLAWNNFPVKLDRSLFFNANTNIEGGAEYYKLDGFTNDAKAFVNSLTTNKPFTDDTDSEDTDLYYPGLASDIPNVIFEIYSNGGSDKNSSRVLVDSENNVFQYQWTYPFLGQAYEKQQNLNIGKNFGCYPKGELGLLEGELDYEDSNGDDSAINSAVNTYIAQLTQYGFKCASLLAASNTSMGVEVCLDTKTQPKNDWGTRIIQLDATGSSGYGSTSEQADKLSSIGFSCSSAACSVSMGYPYFEIVNGHMFISSENDNAENSTDSYVFPNTAVPDDADPDADARDTWTSDLVTCAEDASSKCLAPKFPNPEIYQFPEFVLSNTITLYEREIHFTIAQNDATNFDFVTSPHFFKDSFPPDLGSLPLSEYTLGVPASSEDSPNNINAFLIKYGLSYASLSVNYPQETDESNYIEAHLESSSQEIPDGTFGHVFGLDPESSQYQPFNFDKEYNVSTTSNELNTYESKLRAAGFDCDESDYSCSKDFPISGSNNGYSSITFYWYYQENPQDISTNNVTKGTLTWVVIKND